LADPIFFTGLRPFLFFTGIRCRVMENPCFTTFESADSGAEHLGSFRKIRYIESSEEVSVSSCWY
jgi:hypothetical protein